MTLLIDEALLAVFRLKESVEAEMRERGMDGQLWTNSQCKDWADYESAETVLRVALHRRYQELTANPEAKP